MKKKIYDLTKMRKGSLMLGRVQKIGICPVCKRKGEVWSLFTIHKLEAPGPYYKVIEHCTHKKEPSNE